MKYADHITASDGWTEWIQPIMDGYRLACCDCGLVHEFQFRTVIQGKQVQFRARRNARATAARRRTP